MIYRVQYPFNPDNTPGDLIDYLSICDRKVGAARFIYAALVLNKIVPSNWYAFNELTFLAGINYEWSVGRKPIVNVCGRAHLLYMRPIDATKLKSKKTKSEASLYDMPLQTYRWADIQPLRFEPAEGQNNRPPPDHYVVGTQERFERLARELYIQPAVLHQPNYQPTLPNPAMPQEEPINQENEEADLAFLDEPVDGEEVPW